jgi:plasmid maintenance system antidote protein VapI
MKRKSSIGKNLRKIMENKGIESKSLAKRIGVSSTHLSYIICRLPWDGQGQAFSRFQKHQ